MLSYLFKYYVFTAPERILPHCDMYLYAKPLQVNLFQKHLFLQQLTHNILSYCGLVDARIRGSNKELSTCTVKGLFTLKVRSFQESSNAILISFKKYFVIFVIVILRMTTLFERNEDRVTGFLK